jgi:hypothetical protein
VPEPEADLVFHGSYWAIVDYTRRSKPGEASEFPLTTSGDPGTLGTVAAAFAAARSAATIDTEFPREPARRV